MIHERVFIGKKETILSKYKPSSWMIKVCKLRSLMKTLIIAIPKRFNNERRSKNVEKKTFVFKFDKKNKKTIKK